MPAGKYDTRLTLQVPVTGQDAIGQPNTGWVDVDRVWADVRQANGLQSIKADADSTTVKASVRIRWRIGIFANMRLLHDDGTAYQVSAVLPDRRAGHIDLVCQVTR